MKDNIPGFMGYYVSKTGYPERKCTPIYQGW